MKGAPRRPAGAPAGFWSGWPAKIGDRLPFSLTNEIFKADGLARWSVKNRWVLNRKKPGPRVLELDYGQKIEFKPGQTITHYYARRCVRFIQAGKKAAMVGNADRALMYWAMAETEAERLYGSWLHTLAAKYAAIDLGLTRYRTEEAGSKARDRVKAVLLKLQEWQRYDPGVTAIVAQRADLSMTQARHHIKALGYGSKNK